MKLGQFLVPNVPIISNMKVAHDGKHILMLVSDFIFNNSVGYNKRILSSDYNGRLDQKQHSSVY